MAKTEQTQKPKTWQQEAWEREIAQAHERFGQRLDNPGAQKTDWAAGIAEDVGKIREMSDRVIARLTALPCGGDRERIEPDCTASVLAACESRDRPGCPRAAVALERSMGRSQRNRGRPYSAVLEANGIPKIPALAIASDQVDETQATKAAWAWWRMVPRPVVLVLVGDTGAGKTFAAACVVARHSGRMVRAAEMVERRKDGSFNGSMQLCSLLAIDELGKEGGWADDVEHVANLIAQRIDCGMLTILTANLAPEAIRPRYGEHLADRVAKLGHVAEVAGPSLRSLAIFAARDTGAGEREPGGDDE